MFAGGCDLRCWQDAVLPARPSLISGPFLDDGCAGIDAVDGEIHLAAGNGSVDAEATITVPTERQPPPTEAALRERRHSSPGRRRDPGPGCGRSPLAGRPWRDPERDRERGEHEAGATSQVCHLVSA